MDSSGYSGTPLLKKLGIKESSRVILINAPAELVVPLGPLPMGREAATLDLALLFVSSQAELLGRVKPVLRRLSTNGALWIAWPKKTSKVATDIVEGDLRTLLLPLGIVDVKVCAISEIWSGLKFVVRAENRERWPEMMG